MPACGKRTIRVAVSVGLFTLTLVGLAAKIIDYPAAQLNFPVGQVSYRLPPLLALGLLLAIGVASVPAIVPAAMRVHPNRRIR
jgi:hypothetical protein